MVCMYDLHHANGIVFLSAMDPCAIHAIVTDPPYRVTEYSVEEMRKLRSEHGPTGLWRRPPTLNGKPRSPLPRFTEISPEEAALIDDFFHDFAYGAKRALVPGGHVLIATHPCLSHFVYGRMLHAGFEKRGEIVRLVTTLRGGDRPKGAHQEFPGVSVMARSGWEPWGIFRKPCEGRVQDNLRKWGTGGLRRISNERPFFDVLRASPPGKQERAIAPHPTLKPQALMRALVRASLPLGTGIVFDPFAGSGSTLAAAEYCGYRSVGTELDPVFCHMARQAIEPLSRLAIKPCNEE